MRSALLLCLAAALLAGTAAAKKGAYRSTKHGDPATGVQRPGLVAPPGECSACHDQHASRDGVSNGGPHPRLLLVPGDAALCYTCHAGAGAHAVFPGRVLFQQSRHAMSPSLVWPGPQPPARTTAEAGRCVNCHDPHGTKDAAGVVPAMTFAREEQLCNACHDGSPAQKDIRSEFLKPFRHPVERSGRHDAGEGGDPARYGVSPTNRRHAECADCHNPHRAREDAVPPSPPDASNRIAGTGRVVVTNGAAGSTPIFTWVGPEDPGFAREYELCFKCHSGFTTQPAGQPDLARLLNPANPSYHPVEAAGRDPRIDPAAFVNGWGPSSLVYCSDCHGGDGAGAPRGPHGSSYPYLLKKSYAATSLPQAMAATDLCFDCHAFDVYASAGPNRAASRFNAPSSSRGHTFHVGGRGLTCYACHETHGSTLYPSLAAVGRSPGLTSFTRTPTGGTCSSTCHAARTWTANYGR